MAGVHRNGDARVCGASTVVSGNSTVFANGKLVSVSGDPNSHNDGALIHSGTTVFVEGINIIINGDSAAPDALCVPIGPPHCVPSASSASPNVFAY